MKRYRFQALVTLGDSPRDTPAAMSGGQMRRAVVHGHNHKTGQDKFFNALVTNNSEAHHWAGQDPAIMTIVLMCDDPREYFDIGDSFAFWRGSDFGRGIVTRRLFV